MGRFYSQILVQALADTPGIISSNWTAVLMSLAVFGVIFFIRSRQQDSYKIATSWRDKLAAMREDWKKNLRDGVLVTTVFWLALFTVSLVRRIYNEHRKLASDNDRLNTKNEQLKKENQSLNNRPPSIITKTVKVLEPPAPEANRCWPSAYFSGPEPKWTTSVLVHCNYDLNRARIRVLVDKNCHEGNIRVSTFSGYGGVVTMPVGCSSEKTFEATIMVPNTIKVGEIIIAVIETKEGATEPANPITVWVDQAK